MKKLFVAAMSAIFCLSISTANAIEAPNHEGDINVNIHAGFQPGMGVSASADYVLINSWWKGHFTIGGYASINSYTTDNYRNEYINNVYVETDRSHLATLVAVRATYGLNITKEFEVHAGFYTGPCFHTWKDEASGNGYKLEGERESEVKFIPAGAIAGCRYYFTSNFAVSAELNFSDYGDCSASYINVGVSLKL